MKKRLFILVEGEDDVRFFGRIIKPLFAPFYDSVEIIPYASIKRTKVNSFLKSIGLLNNDYILFADIDEKNSVKEKKQTLYSYYNTIDGSCIIVVIREIESWYYAGLSSESAQMLNVPDLSFTDELTKEDFNRLIPGKYDSRVDFMFEILKYFSLDTARRKNQSFRFFLERYHLEGL